MAGKRYSAGRIFLQVVPSFDNLQRDIQRKVREANPELEKQAAELGKKRGEKGAAAEAKARRERMRREDASEMGKAKKQAEKIGTLRIEVANRTTRSLLSQRAKEAAGLEELAKAHQSGLNKITGSGIMERAKAQIEANRAAQKDEADHQKRLAELRQNSLKKTLDENVAATKAEQAELDRINKRAMAGRIRDAQREHASKLAMLRKAEEDRRRLSGGEAGQRIRSTARGAADALPLERITDDSSKVQRRIQALRAELVSLADAEIGVDIDAAAAMSKLALIQSQLTKLKSQDVDIDVDVNIGAALTKLRALDSVTRDAGNRRGIFAGMFAGLKGNAEDGANSFRVFNWRVLALVSLLPALPPLLAATAGGIGAIATAAVGGAAGLGVMLLGFSGLGEAVGAMGDVADNATKDALASTKAIRNAARGVRDAQQGLDRARMMAGRAAEDSNRRIADAERRLADAQRDATDAQERLREARKAAQKDQEDLADRIASGKLDERQALIDLFNAQVAYNAAMADGGATNLEREQASIDLERARLAIKGIRQENAALATEQKTATREGVEGTDQVVAARRNAEEQQRAIADAERGVADARREAREQAVDSALAIRDAQESLVDAQAAHREALTQTADVGSASMDRLRTAMGKLSPAGAAFATFLFSLRDEFYALRAAAQEGMLPGLQTFLTTIIDRYGPAFTAFVGKMAKVAGDLFVALGHAFTSPTMVAFFETMDKYAPTFFRLFGELGISFMEIIAGLMTAFAPFAAELMTAFAGLAKGWATWAAGLKDNPEFQNFIAYVKEIGPDVLKLFKDIAITLINLGKGLVDNGTFSALVGFFDFLTTVDPKILATIVQGILGFFVASQVSTGITSLVISLRLLFTTIAGAAVLGIGLLIVAFIALYKNNEWFREKVNVIWAKIREYVAVFMTWIQETFLPWFRDEALPVILMVWDKIAFAAQWLWSHVLLPVFRALAPLVQSVFRMIWGYWNNILWPVLKIIGVVVWWVLKEVFWPVFKAIGKVAYEVFKGILWVWENILNPMFDAIADVLNGDFVGAWESALDAVEGIWNGLKRIIAVPVNEAIDILNGLGRGINKIFEAFGSDIRIPVIARVTWGKDNGPETSGGQQRSKGGGASTKGGSFARGGYTGPGGKYEPAGVVHRDEYVIRKEATNRLRQTYGLEFLDFINRSGRIPGLGFAEGGLVGFGKQLQGMGFNVGEHPAFGGVSPVHTKNSWHYKGGAIDVNYDGHGQAFETNKINSILGLAKQFGLRTIWQTKGHYDHAHFDVANGADIGQMNTPPWISKPMGWLRGIVSGLISKVPGNSPFIKAAKSIPNKILGAVESKVAELFGGTGEFDGKHSRNDPTYGVQKWRGTVAKALGLVGQPISLMDVVLRRMNQESSGDYRAINNWDINAKNGTPSKGLMQVIDPTFRAFRMSSLSSDPFDPLANIVASMRYALSRYGSLSTAYNRAGGYASGGLVGGYRDNGAKLYDSGGLLQPGWTTVLNATGKPEPVFTADQYERMQSGATGAPLWAGNIEVKGSNVTATDIADEMMWTLHRISHGGKFAGRAG